MEVERKKRANKNEVSKSTFSGQSFTFKKKIIFTYIPMPSVIVMYGLNPIIAKTLQTKTPFVNETTRIFSLVKQMVTDLRE